MNTLAVPAGEINVLLAGPAAASPAAEGADPRGEEMARPAADFAALLLSAGLGVEARSREAPAEVSAVEPTTEGTAAAVAPTSALDGLLFLAHLQVKVTADGQAATPTAGEAAPVAGVAAETAVPALAALVANRAPGSPAAAGAPRGSEGERLANAGQPPTAPVGTSASPPVDATGIFPTALATGPAVQAAQGSRQQMPDTAAGVIPGSEGTALHTLAGEKAAIDKTAVAGTASDPVPMTATAAVEATPIFATATAAAPFAAAVVRLDVATPVVDPGWRTETAARLTSLVTRGIERAELRLSPAELGPVEVRIDVRGGEATLAIVAAHATTREALEQALPLLRDMLAREGLSLGQATVRDGSADGRPSDRGHARSDGGRFDDEARQRRADETASLPRAASVRRLVDVFA